MAAPPYRFHRFEGRGQAILRSFLDESLSEQFEHADATSAPAPRRSCAFTHLSSSFPLKLLSPRVSSRDATNRVHAAAKGSLAGAKAVAALFVVGYGGGLVSGDSVELDIDVGSGCSLLTLTQGSTKVFQSRVSGNSTPSTPPTTRQSFRYLVRRSASLILLPDPVTCFARSRYAQTQRFDVRSAYTSSLVLLDWLTPGRTLRRFRASSATTEDAFDGALSGTTQSEIWAFDRYASRNEVRVQGVVLARDVLVLEQDLAKLPPVDAGAPPMPTPLAQRNAPYGCYATLLLVGPDAAPVVFQLRSAYHEIQQSRATPATPVQRVLWSLSDLDVRDAQAQAKWQSVEHSGEEGVVGTEELPPAAIVRVAGVDTEDVRAWLREHLTPIKDVIGEDLYKQALGP